MSRHNFERVKASGDTDRVEPPIAPLPWAGGRASQSPDLDALAILLAEVALPILKRLDGCLAELEAVVARIAEAPHGLEPPWGKINVDWFQCRDCLVSDGLNNIPEEWREPCEECLEQVRG